MKIKLFVYGTLMEGYRNYDKYLKGKVIDKKHAYTFGELYHLINKNCPAMITGKNIINGEVLSFYDDDKLTLLKKMDLMEEYFENSPTVMYEREKIKVYYNENSEDLVFAYIFMNKDLLQKNNSIYIKDGNWGRYMTKCE